MDNFKMYYVKDDYIKYLGEFDANVPFNKNQSRPYVGVVIEHDNVQYFAPLSSPKPKHQLLKNSNIDIFKIKNGELGIINLNNMIPVIPSNVIKIDLESKSITYKNLLNEQIQFLNNNKSELLKKAAKLYRLYSNNSIHNIANRCCNFKLLEEKCIDYRNVYENNLESTTKQEVAASEVYVTEKNSMGQAADQKEYSNMDKLKSLSKDGNELSIEQIKAIYQFMKGKVKKGLLDKNDPTFNLLSQINDELNSKLSGNQSSQGIKFDNSSGDMHLK